MKEEKREKSKYKHRKVKPKESSIHGAGIFAKRNIKRGETVFIIKGKPVKWIVTDEKSSAAGPNWIGVGKHNWIDPQWPGSHINHSCEPNTGIRGKVTVVALKNINQDEEITIDYAITEEDLLWRMECLCKSSKCRKEVKSIQHLPEKIFSQYMPFIPHFFKRSRKNHEK